MMSICYHDKDSTIKHFPYLKGCVIHICGNCDEVYDFCGKIYDSLNSCKVEYFGPDDEDSGIAEAFITVDGSSDLLDIVIIYNNYMNGF